MTPWIFLAVSIVGALLTLNTYVGQRDTGPVVLPSFLLGWLFSELPLHTIAWQVVATGLFAAGGAFESAPGFWGLAISVVSWAALFAHVSHSRRAGPIFEASLVAGLGADYRSEIGAEFNEGIDRVAPPPGLALNPFRLNRPEVIRTKDIPYVPEGGKRNQLDVYAPRSGAQGAPVLLQIHGGGWTIGNKHEQALPLMNYMAAQGWVCVAANYRLSPANTFPDHLVDVKRAIAWIRREIAAYGGNPDFIAVTGGSAGGHLTAMVGLTANDPEYQPGFEEVDTRVQAAVPFYGVYDFSDHFRLQPSASIRGFVAKSVLKKDHAREAADFRRASPLHRMHPEAPPFFIVHGSNDGLACVEEARHFAQSLAGISKNPVAYGELPFTQHAFEVFHSIRSSAAVVASGRFLSWAVSRERKAAAG
ncbi:MAG: alpha/beta hydrolase [Myxococcota bacterium]|nr:alpha/beta hydrolase [Myxococcota bacterium]